MLCQCSLCRHMSPVNWNAGRLCCKWECIKRRSITRVVERWSQFGVSRVNSCESSRGLNYSCTAQNKPPQWICISPSSLLLDSSAKTSALTFLAARDLHAHRHSVAHDICRSWSDVCPLFFFNLNLTESFLAMIPFPETEKGCSSVMLWFAITEVAAIIYVSDARTFCTQQELPLLGCILRKRVTFQQNFNQTRFQFFPAKMERCVCVRMRLVFWTLRELSFHSSANERRWKNCWPKRKSWTASLSEGSWLDCLVSEPRVSPVIWWMRCTCLRLFMSNFPLKAEKKAPLMISNEVKSCTYIRQGKPCYSQLSCFDLEKKLLHAFYFCYKWTPCRGTFELFAAKLKTKKWDSQLAGLISSSTKCCISLIFDVSRVTDSWERLISQ